MVGLASIKINSEIILHHTNLNRRSQLKEQILFLESLVLGYIESFAAVSYSCLHRLILPRVSARLLVE